MIDVEAARRAALANGGYSPPSVPANNAPVFIVESDFDLERLRPTVLYLEVHIVGQTCNQAVAHATSPGPTTQTGKEK